MKALVIGYGSIGARHARLLQELGVDTAVVSGRASSFPRIFGAVEPAIAEWCPDYVVIANATADHRETMARVNDAGFRGHVLVEKPIFASSERVESHPFATINVAYNLRFHPVMDRLRERLTGERLLSIQIYVGQYLPDWRPGTDYRRSYSSHAAGGGGVLRDLSHELDYLGYLAGRWRRVAALGGHYSALAGDSDDIFAMLIATERCPVVQLQMNYLDRVGRRQIVINTDRSTIAADFVAATMSVDAEVETFSVGRDDSYRAMHRAVLDGRDAASEQLCGLEEAFDTMTLIEAAERAAHTGHWIAHP